MKKKNSIFTSLKLFFFKEVESKQEEMAFLEAGYDLHDTTLARVEVIVTTVTGKVMSYVADEWNTDLLEFVEA